MNLLENQLCELAETQAQRSARVTQMSHLSKELRDENLEALAEIHFRINSAERNCCAYDPEALALLLPRPWTSGISTTWSGRRGVARPRRGHL